MSDITKKEYYQPLKKEWVSQSGLNEGDFQREVSFAIQHIQNSKQLPKCAPLSFLKAVINIAQVGLTLNPVSKYAYLVPRWNSMSGTSEACLEPSYQGLAKLLTDSGAVISIECQVIWEGDTIEADLSSDRKITKHVPYFLSNKPKGKILGVYSNARLKDGNYHCETMSYQDIQDIRDRSESYKAYLAKKISSCIWITDESEMCRKTIIKRHFKYLPKSFGDETKIQQLQTAIDLDNQINGFDEPVDFGILAIIENMIWQSSLGEIEKESMSRKMNALKTKSDAFRMIDELKDSQPIVGVDRVAMTQYEIMKATKERADRDDFQERNKTIK